jgi:hypothetical protein
MSVNTNRGSRISISWSLDTLVLGPEMNNLSPDQYKQTSKL